MSTISSISMTGHELMTEKSQDEWKRSAKPPIVVLVAGVVSAGKFWVREVPMQQSSPSELTMSSVHYKLNQLEKKLADLYSNQVPKLNPEGQVQNLKANMLVAVRPSYKSKYWYRGQVVNVMFKKDVTAKVFLIDYGYCLEEVNSKSCIRLLPKRLHMLVKPLAFQVFLAGLRPLTMDVDYEVGMQTLGQTVAPKWSGYSDQLVLSLWRQSRRKLAVLQNWRLDRKARAHGELAFLGFNKEINLNDLLVNEGHGAYFETLLLGDLEAKTVKIMGPRFTSICGPGQASGTKTWDSSVDFANLDLNESDDLATVSHTVDNIERPPPEFDFQHLVPSQKFEKCVRRNKKRLDNLRKVASISLNSSFDSSKPMSRMQWIKMRQGKKCEDKKDSSIWDEYRNQPDFIDSDEDEEDKVNRLRRQAQKLEYEKRSLNLPAGIDVGRFINDALKKMPEPIVGPKQIIPHLLKN